MDLWGTFKSQTIAMHIRILLVLFSVLCYLGGAGTVHVHTGPIEKSEVSDV